MKYETKRLKNIENINKRWNKENTTVYDGKKTDTKNTVNDNVNDNVNVTVSKDNKKEIFNFKKSMLDLGVEEKILSDKINN